MTSAETAKRNLHLANACRLERVAVVAKLQDHWRDLPCPRARQRLAELLLDPPPVMAAMPVERVLLACNGLGPVKTDKLLTAARITTGKLRVRDIDPERRHLLSRAVAGEHFDEEDVTLEVEMLRSQVSILRTELRRLRGTA